MTKQSPKPDFVAVTNPDHLPLHLRAYLGSPPVYPRKTRDAMAGTPTWDLVFDTETGTDAAQALRFGSYQWRKNGVLFEAGLFFDPDSLSADEQALLHDFAKTQSLTCRTRAAFVEEVFYGMAYELNAAIIGFNLPFDLSRLAIKHGEAKGRAMRGGFTFTLSDNRYRPNVQVKHLSRRMALLQFTGTFQRQENRRERKNGQTRTRRGMFIDVKTLAAALTARSFSLAALGEHLGTEARKHHTEDHGAALTSEYLAYAMQDAEVTWQCFTKLCAKYDEFRLSQTPVWKVLSEASIGKALLAEMGIRPWRMVQPDFPPAMIGAIMSSYYGGRAEVRQRRVIREVLYCDFLSMYPTVCTLMGLWRFVIADGTQWHDATAETAALLDRVTVEDLQSPAMWKELTTLVRVQPDHDLFPVRTRYAEQRHSKALGEHQRRKRDSTTIGLNHLTSNEPLWFSLADCIASTLLNGRPPRVLEALRFEPGPPQSGLRPVRLADSTSDLVDPAKGDLYQTLIDRRNRIKADLKQAQASDKARLDGEQLALKILANATSYGIFLELNVEDVTKPERRQLFGPDGTNKEISVTSVETPGWYFQPLIGTLITGAARLMLALSERLVIDAGLEWALCDTDSMAIAKPDGMSTAEFQSCAHTVCDWFKPLNPYTVKGPIFKVEDINHRSDGMAEPLYCLAISAKRYVLFNRDAKGLPVIRKASGHGLGHLVAPYGESNPAWRIPKPSHPLSAMGVELWQHDVWWQIIRAHDAGHPAQVDLNIHPAMRSAARSRYGASTPELLAWFEGYNADRPYRHQVKPFNFLLTFQTRAMERNVSPVAPFSGASEDALATVFDRESGQPVEPVRLKSYSQALAQYHLSPEDKFLNANHTDRGTTCRRHVIASGIRLIGKESNRLEELEAKDMPEDAAIDYGLSIKADALHDSSVSDRRLAELAGLSRATIRLIRRQEGRPLSQAVANKVAVAGRLVQHDTHEWERLLVKLTEIVRERGLSNIAALLQVDPSNLKKVIMGKRRMSAPTVARLKAMIRVAHPA
jgi:hypothetical protein